MEQDGTLSFGDFFLVSFLSLRRDFGEKQREKAVC